MKTFQIWEKYETQQHQKKSFQSSQYQNAATPEMILTYLRR
jgi:hypothetical protein